MTYFDVQFNGNTICFCFLGDVLRWSISSTDRFDNLKVKHKPDVAIVVYQPFSCLLSLQAYLWLPLSTFLCLVSWPFHHKWLCVGFHLYYIRTECHYHQLCTSFYWLLESMIHYNWLMDSIFELWYFISAPTTILLPYPSNCNSSLWRREN